MSLVTPFKTWKSQGPIRIATHLNVFSVNLNNYFLENLEGTAYGLKKKNL